jgi:hypothetical protein
VIVATQFVAAAGPVAQTPGATAKQGDRQVTVTGCVQSEADYRSAQDKGRGGVAGTGVGVANEFILSNASSAGDAKKGADAAAAYELTGANEKLAAPHVGHRVEITGTLKAGSASGGPTAGAPPRGTDVVSKDLKLPELEVTAVKMISADCKKQ